MSATTNQLQRLLERVEDEVLRRELAAQIEDLLKRKDFGLVFEEHLPELLPLPNVAPRVGSRVIIDGDTAHTWTVEGLSGQMAKLSRGGGDEPRQEKVRSLSQLTVVKRFGEAIYPKLEPIMAPLEKAPGQPFHTILQGDNYHALQMLLWGYERAFDVIYIDPPYNTGARDWKYNNDYVDGSDRFRHSKWLSMMKRRLLLAKRLLKKDGVMIIAIDDNEVHHLRVLIEEIFSDRDVTAITVIHNPRGSISNNFARTHEYAYFLIPRGGSVIARTATQQARPGTLRRWGHNSTRESRRSMFYPILVKDDAIVGVGAVPADDYHPGGRNTPGENGTTAIWPVDNNGIERRWGFGLGSIEEETERLSVIPTEAGMDVVITTGNTTPKTVWSDTDLDAGRYGASLVRTITGADFPFPKSLYSVKRCLELVSRSNPEALILDFFAGSGTTLHATLLLNAEDGGNRRCILATNNEVSEAEAKALAKDGHKQGDAEWEQEGICQGVTTPRCAYAINGYRADGTPLPGSYLDGRALSQGFEANLGAFKIDFLDPSRVERGAHFKDIAPILWLMAGAQGSCAVDDHASYGRTGASGGSAGTGPVRVECYDWWMPLGAPLAVLLEEHAILPFEEALAERAEQGPPLRHVFLVTDATEAFNDMARRVEAIIEGVRCTQLYRKYLENFRLHQDPAALVEAPVPAEPEAPTPLPPSDFQSATAPSLFPDVDGGAQ